MTARDFCYWLQGYFEVNGMGGHTMSASQVECVQRHLSLVFAHDIDPQAGGEEHQAKLDAIHHPSGPPHVSGTTSQGYIARC